MDFLGMHNEENDNNLWIKEPITEHYETTSHPWGKMKKIAAYMRENTQVDKKCEGERSPSFHCMRKWRMWVNNRMAMHFWVLTFPISQNHISQKLRASPIRIWTTILFLLPCNNYLNQFLSERNDWVNKTRKVVDRLMGFPINIWIFPISSKVLIFPPSYP